MAQSQDEKDVQSIKDPKARKEAYYTQQRRKAQATGSPDAAKISKKLGWGGVARGMAKDTVDSAMSRGPLSMPGGEAAEAVEGAGKALGGVARKALGSAGRDLLKRGEGAVEGAYQRLRNPTPVKRPPGNNTSTLARKTSGKNSSNPNMNMKDSARTTASAKARTNKWTSEARAGYAKDAAETAARRAVNTRPKELTSGQKSLGSSGQWHYEKELGKQAGRKLPKEPKTFNRNGTKRAEGRQKSDRNPVSARAKAPNSHAAIDKMGKKLGASEKNPGGFAQFDKKGTTERIRAAKSKHMDEWSQ